MEGIVRNASACAIVIRKLMRKDEGQWSCQLEVRGYEKPVTKEITIRQELLSQIIQILIISLHLRLKPYLNSPNPTSCPDSTTTKKPSTTPKPGDEYYYL